jgi:GTP cyclohydrolase I
MDNTQKNIADAVTVIISNLGEDVHRDGVMDTPMRVAKAMLEWYRGYNAPSFKITSFKSKYSGLVARRGIPFQSFCVHHMARYKGTIDFAYVPNGRVVGLSKIPRLFQHISARMTIQEGLTHDLIDGFDNLFPKGNKPKGAIIVVKARHSCESTRGVRVDSETITSEVTGVFKKKLSPRDEFFSLVSDFQS